MPDAWKNRSPPPNYRTGDRDRSGAVVKFCHICKHLRTFSGSMKATVCFKYLFMNAGAYNICDDWEDAAGMMRLNAERRGNRGAHGVEAASERIRRTSEQSRWFDKYLMKRKLNETEERRTISLCDYRPIGQASACLAHFTSSSSLFVLLNSGLYGSFRIVAFMLLSNLIS